MQLLDKFTLMHGLPGPAPGKVIDVLKLTSNDPGMLPPEQKVLDKFSRRH